MFTGLYVKLKNIRKPQIISLIKKFTAWKFFPVFLSTFLVFSIITIQFAESRQYIKKIPMEGIDNIFELEVNRYEKQLEVKQGETLSSILESTGVKGTEISDIVEKLSPLYNLRQLKPGQKIKLIMFKGDNNQHPFIELLRIEKNKELEVRVSLKNGSYEAKTVPVKTISIKKTAEGSITDSLYLDASRAGLPDSAIMDFFHLCSFDVDFQRDIYKGDKFKVYYENIMNRDGELVSQGDIIFAQLDMQLKDEPLNIYRFRTDEGKTDYFNEKGENVRKTLLKTPIYGARISSGYGRRKHPISGYSHIHRALDFAAPKNTPIMASGNGTVELAAWNNGYGKCVILRHANQYKTLYAHLNLYGNGIRKGTKVKQGQIIGYVGTTGTSTGYHLHYEVIFRGRKINPSTIKTPPERKLTELEKDRFFTEKEKIDRGLELFSLNNSAELL